MARRIADAGGRVDSKATTGDAPDEASGPRAAHRAWLIEADHKAAGDFDKAIMTMAGGALALSQGLLRPGSTPSNAWTLLLAWVFLVGSLLSTLVSFLTSQKALRVAIDQVDSGSPGDKDPGGGFATATSLLNYVAAVLLVAGLSFLTAFVWLNLERLGKP